MSSGSIKSGFQFDSYKVDKIEFSTKQNIATLASKPESYEVKYSFAFRDALKYSKIAKNVLYVTGIKVFVSVMTKEDSTEMANGTFEITGLFHGIGTLDQNQEEALAKTQGPAILFPYARAIISQTLYNAGFAINLMPLLNVNEMARNANVKVIEA